MGRVTESVRRQLGRVTIVRRAWHGLRKVSGLEGGHPVPVSVLRQTLTEMGVGPGDILHVQSSVNHLYQGWAHRVPEEAGGQVAYATRIVRMLMDLVGPSGTVMMNTDSVTQAQVRSAWAGVLPPDGPLFDYATSASRRGLISELFRRQAGAVRSVHPWYNMTAAGPAADELMRDNEQSAPYALDRHSAMWKLTMSGGKVILLGRGFYGNVPLHLIEYAYPEEYPRAVFMNRPVKMTYRRYDGRVDHVDVLLHAPGWYVTMASGVNFCNYLDRRYGIYKRRTFNNGAEVVFFDGKAQYEATYREMKAGVCCFDPQFDE